MYSQCLFVDAMDTWFMRVWILADIGLGFSGWQSLIEVSDAWCKLLEFKEEKRA